MSKELDDKLTDILLGPTSTNEAVQLVKQAFADEGYLPHVDSGKHVKVGDKLYVTNGSDPLVRVDLAKYMTGQEWYDRFEKEFRELTENRHRTYLDEFGTDDILGVAKRAAGLADE